MNKQEIYKEIESALGQVPTFFKSIPESSLELEWKLFKLLELEQGAIPPKYRELIGVAVSAATKCHYCSFFHTGMAKLNGATDEEIEDAVHVAKNSAGWSTYLNGMQVDFEKFKSEVQEVGAYVKSQR